MLRDGVRGERYFFQFFQDLFTIFPKYAYKDKKNRQFFAQPTAADDIFPLLSSGPPQKIPGSTPAMLNMRKLRTVSMICHSFMILTD